MANQKLRWGDGGGKRLNVDFLQGVAWTEELLNDESVRSEKWYDGWKKESGNETTRSACYWFGMLIHAQSRNQSGYFRVAEKLVLMNGQSALLVSGNCQPVKVLETDCWVSQIVQETANLIATACP